jgi:hypothetical protein
MLCLQILKRHNTECCTINVPPVKHHVNSLTPQFGIMQSFSVCLLSSGLWPSKSPNLTLLDILFWGYIKDYVYVNEIRDMNHLKPWIKEAAGQVTRYAATCVARSGISIGRMRGREQYICWNFLIIFKTIWGALQIKPYFSEYAPHFYKYCFSKPHHYFWDILYNQSGC